ncbi:MAG: 5'/3'-nucleotidase SurE, partial [Mycobacterium sp.]
MTNDDGYFAPGIAALATRLVKDGHDVTVAAPMEDRSGTGTGIGLSLLEGGIAFERVHIEGLGDTPVYGVHGLPALAVFAAGLSGFGPPPDLVVSGVNYGFNTGRSVMHSGTVGAALTAANFNISGLAVSTEALEEPYWETATTLA